MDNKKREEVYNHLVFNNDKDYTIKKTVEELLELALILQQKLNKPKLVKDHKIIEEIGDVKIRMKVLEQIFPEEKIKERVNFKLKKFYKYIQEKKYKNI